MARALTLAAGIVLLAAAGVAFLASLVVLVPVGETDADTWLGDGILLCAALLAGGIADLLIIRGVRPRAARRTPTAPERPAPSRPAAGGVDLGSTVGPAFHELGFQLFGVVGGLLADLLTAFLGRRRRGRGGPAPSVRTRHRGRMARTLAGLRTAAALVLIMLWAGAIGGLEGVVEGFVNAPATTWDTLTTEPALQVALAVCLGMAGVGGLVLSRLRRATRV